MDGQSFDELTRAIGAAVPRRRVVKGLAAAVVAGALSSLGHGDTGAARCKSSGKKCKTNRDCCSARCKGNRRRKKCRAGTTGRTCRANKDCRSRACACGAAGQRVCWSESWSQDFNANLIGWFDYLTRPSNLAGGRLQTPGAAIQRRLANNIPIPPRSGPYVGQINGPVDAITSNAITALTTWGGYKQTMPAGGFTVSLDIYLDPSGTTDPNALFSYVAAASDPDDCGLGAELIFRVGNGPEVPDALCITASDQDMTSSACGGGEEVVELARIPTNTGWYTFTAQLQPGANNQLTGTATFTGPPLLQPVTWDFTYPGGLGGNRHAWFPIVQGITEVWIDNAVRTSG